MENISEQVKQKTERAIEKFTADFNDLITQMQVDGYDVDGSKYSIMTGYVNDVRMNLSNMQHEVSITLYKHQ